MLAFGMPVFQRPHRTFWIVVPAAIALIPAVVIARSFGRIDMLAIWFHADFGMAGATLEGLRSQILWAVSTTVMLVGCFALLAGLWRWRQRGMILLTLGLIGLNPFVRAVALDTLTPGITSDLFERFAAPVLVTVAPDRPDVVVIYLEGTDRQYADPEVWGDLYAPLKTLAAEGAAFTRVGQMTGTNWSLAGMVATQCGVPVMPFGLFYKFNYIRLDAFMPGLTCLGDVALQKGYDTTYVVGGELAFGGIGSFYATHGFRNMIGAVEIRARYPADTVASAFGGWVLDDQIVFDTARQELDRMVSQTAPFLLVVETIGPHDMKGVLSRRCNDGKTAALSPDVAKVVQCLLDGTLSFVRETQRLHAATRPDRDLRFVTLSDHLSHSTGMLPMVAPAYAGANTAIFVGGPLRGGQQVHKPGAMIDIYPTMLEWLGFAAAPVSAGLGQSLLGQQPTVVEVHGMATLDRMVTSDVPLSKAIWGIEQ